MGTSAGDQLAGSVGALRRYTRWTFALSVAVTAVLPIGSLFTVQLPAGRVALLLALLAAATVPRARLLRDAIEHPGGGVRAPWWAASGGVAALALVVLVPAEAMPMWALPAGGVVGALAVTTRPAARWSVLATGAVLTAVCAALAAAVGAGGASPAVAGGWALGAVLVITLADVGQIWIWEVALRLDEARRTEAELAVAGERLRFAADLHDLQGHQLQVIALKGELVARLVGVDDATARAEAAEIGEIARTALAETRDVVSGYRRAGLETEVGNAVGILQAAGIATEVHGSPDDVPVALQPLFAALVREGTTNVLRHSNARHATLQLGASSVRLCNDGAPAGTLDGGSGITGLQQRFGAAGGGVRAGHAGDDTFELVGTA